MRQPEKCFGYARGQAEHVLQRLGGVEVWFELRDGLLNSAFETRSDSCEKRRPSLLRRYTDLTTTIDLLSRKRLVLLDPAFWDDRNDSYFIGKYKEQIGAKSVLALCMSTIGETIITGGRSVVTQVEHVSNSGRRSFLNTLGPQRPTGIFATNC